MSGWRTLWTNTRLLWTHVLWRKSTKRTLWFHFSKDMSKGLRRRKRRRRRKRLGRSLTRSWMRTSTGFRMIRWWGWWKKPGILRIWESCRKLLSFRFPLVWMICRSCWERIMLIAWWNWWTRRRNTVTWGGLIWRTRLLYFNRKMKILITRHFLGNFILICTWYLISPP